MNIILPIVVVALVLGLSRNKMNAALWVIMVLAIAATLGHYALKH